MKLNVKNNNRLMMDVTKVLVGEHRPHFFETCRPDASINCTIGWVRLIIEVKLIFHGFIFLVNLSRVMNAQIQSHQLIICVMFHEVFQAAIHPFQPTQLYSWFGIFNVACQKFNLSSSCLLFKSFSLSLWVYAVFLVSLTIVIIGLTWLGVSFWELSLLFTHARCSWIISIDMINWNQLWAVWMDRRIVVSDDYSRR